MTRTPAFHRSKLTVAPYRFPSLRSFVGVHEAPSAQVIGGGGGAGGAGTQSTWGEPPPLPRKRSVITPLPSVSVGRSSRKGATYEMSSAPSAWSIWRPGSLR